MLRVAAFENRLSRPLSFLQDPESTRAATQLSGEFTGGIRTSHYGQPSVRFARRQNHHIPNGGVFTPKWKYFRGSKWEMEE